MTVQELTQVYNKELNEAYEKVKEVQYKFVEEMNNILNEKHLNELVLRKADNRVGEIWVGWDYWNNPEVTFHPLTKKKNQVLMDKQFIHF